MTGKGGLYCTNMLIHILIPLSGGAIIFKYYHLFFLWSQTQGRSLSAPFLLLKGQEQIL